MRNECDCIPLSPRKENGKKAKTKNTIVRNSAIAFVLLNLLSCLTGCSDRPTDAELERLRQEAIVQNQALVALHNKDKGSWSNWQFVVQGQTSTDAPVALTMSDLQTLATTSISTKEPHNTLTPKAIFNFRGVAISKLLDKFGVASGVTEVTFVSYDAYRATVSLADLRQYPIAIALERNGQKISRSEGGPIYLVFPYSQFPQLQKKYPDRFWAFYLTGMVVGTEPINLKVNAISQGKSQRFRLFNAAALEKLPQVTVEEAVGYRIGWPVGKVKLHGVRLRDVVAAGGLTLLQNGAVIVRGKSQIYRDPANPVRLEASYVKECDILLATHWDDERKPIPAKMGGPVTLALSSACPTQASDRRWVTFVEELQVISSRELGGTIQPTPKINGEPSEQ